jgi:hypothetical protein
MERRFNRVLLLSLASTIRLKSPATAHAPASTARSARNSSRNKGLSSSTVGPYTAVSHQAGPPAHETCTDTENWSVREPTTWTSSLFHATITPPAEPTAGKYANPSKRGPKHSVISKAVTACSLDSETQTTEALASSTATRTAVLRTGLLRLVPTWAGGGALSSGGRREGGERAVAGAGSVARRERAIPPGRHNQHTKEGLAKLHLLQPTVHLENYH